MFENKKKKMREPTCGEERVDKSADVMAQPGEYHTAMPVSSISIRLTLRFARSAQYAMASVRASERLWSPSLNMASDVTCSEMPTWQARPRRKEQRNRERERESDERRGMK